MGPWSPETSLASGRPFVLSPVGGRLSTGSYCLVVGGANQVFVVNLDEVAVALEADRRGAQVELLCR